MNQISWSSKPVAELSSEEIQHLTELINTANRAKKRIFPGDRLGPEGITTNYYSHFTILARIDEALAGCVFGRSDGTVLWLSLLAVAPSRQGGGLGQKLLQKAEEVARDLRLSGLKLEAVDLGRLIPYYVSLGFQTISVERCPQGKWNSVCEFDLATMIREI